MVNEPTKEVFSNNKVQEAICQFTFKTELDVTSLESFIDHIISDKVYTHFERPSFLQFNIKFALTGENNNTQQLQGVKFFSPDKSKVVQIFSNNISIHQVGKYESWELYKKDIDYFLNKFSQYYDVEIARIDLRNINNFNFIHLNNINEYLNFNLALPQNLAKTNAINFSIDQVLDINQNFISTRASYNDLQKQFILDLNFVNLTDRNVKTTSLEYIHSTLEKGHSNLYKIFIESITEKTKNLIK